MGFIYKLTQLFLVAELFVDVVIIAYVVFVIRNGAEYGRKIQCVYS